MTDLYESAYFQNKPSLSVALLKMEPDWNNFTLFGGQLIGPDVFNTWNTKTVSLCRPFVENIYINKTFMIQALDFLRDVKDKPEDHGITGEDHINGVQDTYNSRKVVIPGPI